MFVEKERKKKNMLNILAEILLFFSYIFVIVVNSEVCTKEGLFSLSQSLVSDLSPFFAQMAEVR